MFRDTKFKIDISGTFKTLRIYLLLPGLALALLALVYSCSVPDSRVSIPSGLIPRDTLVHLLVDIHLADAFLSQNRLPKEKDGRNAFYAGITKKYGYERVMFDSTIHYLATQPKLYNDIYEEVLNQLSLIQGQVEKEKAFLEENTEEGEDFSFKKSVNDEEIENAVTQDSSAIIRLREAQKRFEKIRGIRKVKE
ncbi:MAG: DUF4296 domain-containing protein [Bacteroidales bacterium]|nr:DUF4296 domain-containing protein [Bacteroidales bacterium]MCF8456931.1 DUF4296 domain-containing protein [Bacteroidales bacterium]